MLNRGGLSPDDVRNIAYRIKACRVLTWLNQEEFASKHNIPLPTLKCWEQGVVPRAEGVSRIIEALRGEGVFVESDWLMNGYGTGPAYSLEDKECTSSVLEDEAASSNEFLNIFREQCKKNKKNPVIASIIDDEMEYLFSPGDLVAGVLLDPSQIGDDENSNEVVLRPILVKLGNGLYAPRWVHAIGGYFYIRSEKCKRLKRAPFSSFAQIYCHLSAKVAGLNG